MNTLACLMNYYSSPKARCVKKVNRIGNKKTENQKQVSIIMVFREKVIVLVHIVWSSCYYHIPNFYAKIVCSRRPKVLTRSFFHRWYTWLKKGHWRGKPFLCSIVLKNLSQLSLFLSCFWENFLDFLNGFWQNCGVMTLEYG